VARNSSPSPRPFALLFGSALAAAVTLGCAPAPASGGPAVTFDPCTPVMLIPDANATADQVAGVAAGAALWNASAGADVLTTSALPSPLPGDGGVAPTLPIHFQTAAAPFHGLYDAPNGQIFINEDLTGEELAITVAHEVGHSFGLVHIPPDQRASLMNPGNLTVLPTPQDVATLAGLWGRCGSLDAAGTE
jgi:hypothetical protein